MIRIALSEKSSGDLFVNMLNSMSDIVAGRPRETTTLDFEVWLNEYCPKRYKIVNTSNNWILPVYTVEFEDAKDAMLFKLTWGGI